MFDIDHFKEYNDTYGHQQGDEALIKVAKVLASHTARSDDNAFRIGGEEFAISTVGLDFKQSLNFANLIKDDILALEIPHIKNEENEFLTISGGVYNEKGANIIQKDEIILLADKALYKSKDNGRNQITINKQGETDA